MGFKRVKNKKKSKQTVKNIIYTVASGFLKADEEIRTLDPLLGKEMLTELHPHVGAWNAPSDIGIMQHRGALGQAKRKPMNGRRRGGGRSKGERALDGRDKKQQNAWLKYSMSWIDIGAAKYSQAWKAHKLTTTTINF